MNLNSSTASHPPSRVCNGRRGATTRLERLIQIPSLSPRMGSLRKRRPGKEIVKPVNELQTLCVEIMRLSTVSDYVLNLHCDVHSVLHLFTSASDWPPACAMSVIPTLSLSPVCMGPCGATCATGLPRLQYHRPACRSPSKCAASLMSATRWVGVMPDTHYLQEPNQWGFVFLPARRAFILAWPGDVPHNWRPDFAASNERFSAQTIDRTGQITVLPRMASDSTEIGLPSSRRW